jgi:CubicO group peptidase (beta-lactamase class C family)
MKRVLIYLLLFFVSAYPQNFTRIDSIVNNAISNKVFPSASILVGNDTGIFLQKAYGRYTYDAGSSAAETTSMYDLASVTKAFGTNLCVMKLAGEKIINIDDPVSKFIPEYSTGPKGRITLKNLLLHNSGLPPYYTPKEGETRDVILDSVKNIQLDYETGSKSVYSCLNFVTLMLVVEKASSLSLSEYYRKNIVEPLGLTSTMFTPAGEFIERCVPTTPELQGVVHDPLARGLLGLSGNAGLFSTASDLAVITRMLMNGGMHEGNEIISRSTVELFRARDSELSTRALGFDTKSDSGYSSAGSLFSKGSYGHLGYTGTSIWIDQERKIFIVLLTNRVYPDDKASIRNFRAEFHNAVVNSLDAL